MTAAFLPKVPRPPHDPLSCVLNAHAGWRMADGENIEVTHPEGSLALIPQAIGHRSLFEPGWTFGGLSLPRNVALDKTCGLWLLDVTSAELKRFDSCECVFRRVPKTGGVGTQPRRFHNPGGIGVCGGNLFVCDTDNNRVQIFTVPGMLLRAIWNSPGFVDELWQPTDISFNSQKQVLVGDKANGAVHMFSTGGEHIRSFNGFGKVEALAVDCKDRLYVLAADTDHVFVVDTETGTVLETVDDRSEIANEFKILPFPITVKGNIVLDSFCCLTDLEGVETPLTFNLSGEPVVDKTSNPPPLYEPDGSFFSQALNSDLYRCQWDRLALKAKVPAGTRIKVFTYTSESEQPFALIKALSDDAWSTAQTMRAGPLDRDPVWDCLIRSAAGRFLWLKLEFQGDGTATPQLVDIRLTFPRISLRRYLPAVFGTEPISTDFTDRFLAVFDQSFRRVEKEIDQQARLFDPLSAPATRGRDFLTWLGTWIGIALERNWSLARRRQYLDQVGKLFKSRGTASGLYRQLLLYLGLDNVGAHCPQLTQCGPCTLEPRPRWQPPPLILEHFKLRRWLFLGHGRLGDQARLWGEKIVNRTRLEGKSVHGGGRLGVTQLKISQDPLRDPYHTYAHQFSVFAPSRFETPQLHKGLQRLIELERPAHTAFQIIYVKPRFRIGIQSMIGLDAVVGCYEEGITLHETTALGRGTILTSRTEGGGESIQIGTNARIGATTTIH